MDRSRHVKVFDTTLRDGQQCPGAGMSFQKNIEYAELAWGLGVDVLEAGFPSASKADFEIVETIARELAPRKDSPMIAALCQQRDEQVDRTIEALLPAVQYGKARVHTYLPVDPALMAASLGERANHKTKLVDEVYAFIKRAVDAGMEVEFSGEGYSRMGENFDFVTDMIRAAVKAGATVINCPDTIGLACRYQGKDYYVEKMKEHAAIIDREFPGNTVTWSAHCHNDYGLAVENTVNAVFEGPARQIEGCINGIGERAGNVSLEQCIMVIKHFSMESDRHDPFYTKIKTEKLKKISDFVASNMLVRQPHWPVTGANAAKHSAGGHTNAILRDPLIYQAFDPAEVGDAISFLFGPLSGGNHSKSIIENAGYRCEESEKAEIAQFIKDLYSERRKGITDDELLHGYFEYRKPISITACDYAKRNNKSEVALTGKFFGRDGLKQEARESRDSALATVKQAIDEEFPGLSIQSYNSESIGSGIHAASLSTIVINDANGRQFVGKGEDNDIEISAIKALINAVNTAYIDICFRSNASVMV